MKNVKAYVKGFEKDKLIGYIIAVLSSKTVSVYVSVRKKTRSIEDLRASENSEEIKAAQRLITEAISHGSEKITIYHTFESTAKGIIPPVFSDESLKLSFIQTVNYIDDVYVSFMNELVELTDEEVYRKIQMYGSKFKIDKPKFSELSPTAAEQLIDGLDDRKFLYKRKVM